MSAPSRPHLGFRLRPFRPARWLPGPHLQTVGGKFLRPRGDLPLQRERWVTPDGDFLDLDLTPDPGEEAPVVVILHGLEGSTGRGYVRVAMGELFSHGILAVGMNFRSCSGEPNRAAHFYHSGETGDLGWVLEGLRERLPDRPLGALGFSLGGNVLLKLLGELGEDAPDLLQAAAAISVPFDLVAGTRALESGTMGRLYTHYFLRSLRSKAEAKGERLGRVVDLERIRVARTLREFDDAATAPLHGFPDAWTYYRESSSGPFLPSIRVPTLLLQARDDPFLPEEAIPVSAMRSNPWLHTGVEGAGGHVGFVAAGSPAQPEFWAEREAARYLSRLLNRQSP